MALLTLHVRTLVCGIFGKDRIWKDTLGGLL